MALAWSDDVQNLLLGGMKCAWRLDAKLAALGWGLSGASATAGDWSDEGDNLVTGNWRSRRSPAGAPFRWDFKYIVGPNYIDLYAAPHVGTAGGWNEAGPSFDAPYNVGRRFYTNSAAAATNFNIIANDRAVIIWAYWTPAAYTGNITFTADDTIVLNAVNFDTIGWALGAHIKVTANGGANLNKQFRFTGLDDDQTAFVEPTNESSGALVTSVGAASATVQVQPVHYLAYIGQFKPTEILASFTDARPLVLACGIRTIPTGDYPNNFSVLRGMRRIYAKTSSGYVSLVDGGAVLPKDAGMDTSPLDSDDQAYSTTGSGHGWLESVRIRWAEQVSAVDYRDMGGRLEGVMLASSGHTRRRIGQHPTDSTKSLYMSHNGIAHVWPNGLAASA